MFAENISGYKSDRMCVPLECVRGIAYGFHGTVSTALGGIAPNAEMIVRYQRTVPIPFRTHIMMIPTMPLTDPIAAAKQIDSLFTQLIAQGGFRLKYRITVNPPASPLTGEAPAILVDFSGPDSSMVIAHGGELLRSFEHLIQKTLRLEHEEQDKIAVDCGNQRSARAEELALAARVAAEKVRESGVPYRFAPMNSRERRMLHMSLRNETDLRTESAGEGYERALVVYPKDYKSPAFKPRERGRR